MCKLDNWFQREENLCILEVEQVQHKKMSLENFLLIFSFLQMQGLLGPY